MTSKSFTMIWQTRVRSPRAQERKGGLRITRVSQRNLQRKMSLTLVTSTIGS